MEEVKKTLSDINIAYIDKNKVVKTIKFSEGFDSRSCEDRAEYLLALASSLNHAAEVAYKERDEIAAKFETVLALNENAAKSAGMSQSLMEQAITESNAEKQELMKRIAELKKEIREKDHLLRQLAE